MTRRLPTGLAVVATVAAGLVFTGGTAGATETGTDAFAITTRIQYLPGSGVKRHAGMVE
jgi:hypothetical protein